MKTQDEIIRFCISELKSNNALTIATLGNGGAGLDLVQNQENDFIDQFRYELNGYSFDGLVDACDDIKESEYYDENCEVYQFSDDNGYKLQIVTY